MITQRYKNHDVVFDDDTEEWRCDDLALSDKSLKVLKGAIDRADKKDRTMAVPAVYVEESYHNDRPAKLLDCTIVLMRADRRPKANIKIVGRKGIENVELRELYPAFEREKVAAYVDVQNRRAALDKQMDELKDDLTPLTPELLRELVTRQADDAA
jgi:hypothetical protein